MTPFFMDLAECLLYSLLNFLLFLLSFFVKIWPPPSIYIIPPLFIFAFKSLKYGLISPFSLSRLFFFFLDFSFLFLEFSYLVKEDQVSSLAHFSPSFIYTLPPFLSFQEFSWALWNYHFAPWLPHYFHDVTLQISLLTLNPFQYFHTNNVHN